MASLKLVHVRFYRIEFVYLAGDCGSVSDELTKRGVARTFSVIVVALVAKDVDILIYELKFAADGLETLVEPGSAGVVELGGLRRDIDGRSDDVDGDGDGRGRGCRLQGAMLWDVYTVRNQTSF